VFRIILFLLFFLILDVNQALAQKFAVIGDYGEDDGNELAVANLVKSWNPDFIITVGDNKEDDTIKIISNDTNYK
jgi:tartrate-resistant acid phosphatase type 5